VLGKLKHPLIIAAVIASLVGCRTAADQQYQTAARSLASEQCRALQAVVEERERYGIVARSRDLDQDALRRCGLPWSEGGGPPFQTTPYSGGVRTPTADRPQLNSSTDEVKIERRGNSFRVPVRINETITLPFVLDTGAEELAIPADVALTLIRAGALNGSDFVGKARYSMANGTEQVTDRVIIREVQVGDHIVTNVMAFVSPPAGDLLLGQSFLSKFGAVTVDYKRLVLILSR
jgi:clan AA aspartic protease (TIGR02281 family)